VGFDIKQEGTLSWASSLNWLIKSGVGLPMADPVVHDELSEYARS
jgi:hypothetical protein